MRKLLACLALIAFTGLVIAQDAVKKETNLLEGDWTMMSGTANGVM